MSKEKNNWEKELEEILARTTGAGESITGWEGWVKKFYQIFKETDLPTEYWETDMLETMLLCLKSAQKHLRVCQIGPAALVLGFQFGQAWERYTKEKAG